MVRGMVWQRGRGNGRSAQVLRGHIANSRSVWIAAVAIPLMLLAPAFWNGYPLLQWDTGGYLARWYEGYLVPSRSTVFGIYLHLARIHVLDQSRNSSAGNAVDPAADPARAGLAQPLRLLAISLVLAVTTALPWLASTLLTDILPVCRCCRSSS